MPDIKDQASLLGKKIRLYTARERHIHNTEVNDNSLFWRKQDFIAEILLNSTEQKYFAPNRNVLEKLKNEFTTRTGIEIDLDKLFDKFWLRTVVDIIHMPAAITGSIYSAKKIADCKNELLFLRTIKVKSDEKLSVEDFNKLRDSYQNENGLVLDLDKAIQAHLLTIDAEIVKITNVGYYAPIVDNWDNFQFLIFFYDEIQKNNKLIISKDKLEAIYADNKSKYALTPSTDEMVKSGLATLNVDHFELTLFKGGYCSHDILEEAGAILWRKLSEANTSIPSEELMALWCRKFVIAGNRESDIYKYLSVNEVDQFNRSAVALIMKEQDLANGLDEYKKALLDYYMDRDVMTLQLVERINSSHFTDRFEDPFDTLTALSGVQRWITDDYLYFAQSCREVISYLVGQIVRSHKCDFYSFDRIKDLTVGIHEKPYLIWTLAFWIWYWRPELIPVLMPNTEMASALFAISKKADITTLTFEPVEDVRFQIATSLFRHLLTIQQADLGTTNQRKAKIIFDCLLNVTAPKYQIKGQDLRLQKSASEAAKDISDALKNEFKDRPDQYPIYNHANTQEKYYPQLLPNLFNKIATLKQENRYNNGVIDFHYIKLDLLLYVATLSDLISKRDSQYRLPKYDIALAMQQCYLDTITTIDTTIQNFGTWEPEKTIPIFLPATQNIVSVDWATIYLYLEAENLSLPFLNPANLTFNQIGNDYDSYNKFIIDKLRIHLRVLITTYQQLKKEEHQLKKLGTQVDNSLIRLQNAIMDIVLPYAKNEPSKHRYDIFNRFDERPTYSNSQSELIPELGEVSNHFSANDRERIINALLQSDSFVRILKLMEVMTSEQDQMLLLNALNAQNTTEELKKVSALPDLQFIMSALSKHQKFQNKAIETLTYWESVTKRKEDSVLGNEIKATTYRTKLLLSFQENDLKAIEEVPEPQGQIYLHNMRLYPRNEKDFYRALYYFKNDKPEDAYNLFNDLVFRKDDDTVTVALNRFAAKIKWAESETDSVKKNKLFTEALSEWNTYQEDLPPNIALDSIADNLLYNKLTVFDALELYNEFDALYSTIDYIDRVRSGLFEIGVKNRITRKMTPEAIGLIKEATEYHKLKDGTIPDFVRDMNDLVVKNQDPEILQDMLSALLTSNPEYLVKLIPSSINDGDNPNDYILNFLIQTAEEMLSKINSVAEITYEDKYSDLMIMGLNGILKFHHWHVSPARGGYANSSLDNPGEIDFAVYAANNQEIAICEALNLSGENNHEVKKHSVKIFNYTPSKKGLFLLVYYRGPEVNFLSSWEKYKNSITNYVEFPESYLMTTDSLVDISEKQGNAAIKVGISSHGAGIILHHVFVNINYKATVKN